MTIMNNALDKSDNSNPQQHATDLILKVAIPGLPYGVFDYLPPALWDLSHLQPGVRLQVPFANKPRIGLLISTSQKSDIPVSKLKYADTILDSSPILSKSDLALLHWATEYYHHATGDVYFTALPQLLRRGKPLASIENRVWRISSSGKNINADLLAKAPLQQRLLTHLQNNPQGCHPKHLQTFGNWKTPMKRLQEKTYVEWVLDETETQAKQTFTSSSNTKLNEEQLNAVKKIRNHLSNYCCTVLQGVTGSGKTEVYFSIIDLLLLEGKQILILIPEIALTGQTITRFQQRFSVEMAVLHSGLTDKQRLLAWQSAQTGKARIVIGTRSAVWTPLPKLGLIVVDEEHDLSFKQQEGFRYSARDVAVLRAQRCNCSIILGSATPSLESLHNIDQERYQRVFLHHRAGKAVPPKIVLLDCRQQQMTAGLSAPLIQHIGEHIARNQQVLVFLNRRGYSPVLMCHECGWIPDCHYCDAHMTYHKLGHRLCCHHCGAEHRLPSACPTCSCEHLIHVGQGTERLETVLTELFPSAHIVRIDRDTTRRKGVMAQHLAQVHQGEVDILVGTQMLAKGHHFPKVTLVCIIDADSRLYSADFRAPERLAQLILQVAGRAGRVEQPGTVLLQTHHPEHPLLQTIISQNYDNFAIDALRERQLAQLPPFTSLALLRSSSIDSSSALAFLSLAYQQAIKLGIPQNDILGPMPSPMERREGRFRAQLLIQANNRPNLHARLKQWLPQISQLKEARKIRWSIDVDPLEML